MNKSAIEGLIRAGIDLVRINFSHGTLAPLKPAVSCPITKESIARAAAAMQVDYIAVSFVRNAEDIR